MLRKTDKASEFFYMQNGKRSDVDLHEPIIALGEVKLGLRPPMVDKARLDMIRAKHARKKHEPRSN